MGMYRCFSLLNNGRSKPMPSVPHYCCIVAVMHTVCPSCSFHKYVRLVEDKLMPRYNAVWHWAKLEPQHDTAQLDAGRLARVRERLVKRFGAATLKRFADYRAVLDPTVRGQPLLSFDLTQGCVVCTV